MLKQSSLFSLFLLLITLPLPAQEEPPAGEPESSPRISEQEIKSDRVEFINRTNRPATAAIRTQELSVGTQLAEGVIAQHSADIDGVTIKRIFSADSPLYGADTISIKESASFGHINVLERILTGYISRAFEYSPKDARVLARFVLYYNASIRKDMEKINRKYTPEVASSVDPARVGIDRSYSNWPGNTELLIPLRGSAVRPDETDMDNGELKRETTTEAPKKEQKQLETLQERRDKEEIKKLDEKKEEIRQEKRQIKKEETATQTEIQKTEKRLETLKKEPEKNREAIKQAEQKKETLVKKQKTLKQKEQSATKQEQKVTAQKQAIKQKKSESAAKESGPKVTVTPQQEVAQLKKENQELKAKQQAIEEKSPNVIGEKILFMRVLKYTPSSHYQSELWAIDAANDDALMRSPYLNICGRQFLVIPNDGILVIGFPGEADHETDHNLVLLDEESLTRKAISKETIYFATPLKFMDGKIYVIEEYNGEYHLTRFNPDLTVDVRSDETVNLHSEITFTKNKIYLTGKKSGSGATLIAVFARSDLKLVKTFEPLETR